MTKFKIKPLEDRVIIKPAVKEERTQGGIILPDTVEKEKPIEGTVIATGPGKTKDDGRVIPMNVKAGDKVLYGKYSGSEVKIDDEEYLIMRESDIFGILS